MNESLVPGWLGLRKNQKRVGRAELKIGSRCDRNKESGKALVRLVRRCLHHDIRPDNRDAGFRQTRSKMAVSTQRESSICLRNLFYQRLEARRLWSHRLS